MKLPIEGVIGVDIARLDAAPDVSQWARRLPKTRSGKIIRRILRKIAENEIGSLGDTSASADPRVVDHLVKGRTITV